MGSEYRGDNRIVMDWDGTCVPQVWPECPEEWTVDPFTGMSAAVAMKEMLLGGREVVIASTRLAPRATDELTPLTQTEKDREVRYIRGMLDRAGLHQVGIWRKPWKPGAAFYVDDKGVEFTGDWTEVLRKIGL